jgi:hypothetical protein
MTAPARLHVHTTQHDTLGIEFAFAASVANVDFELTHSEWGVLTARGSGVTVTFTPTEEQAATVPGTYSYYLVASPGVVGAEQTVARGKFVIHARSGA